MNKEEQLFHEALQRQNDRLARRMRLSEDFNDRLMQRIGGQKLRRRRRWYYAAVGAVAASVVLMVVLGPRTEQRKSLPVAVNVQPAREVVKVRPLAVGSKEGREEAVQQAPVTGERSSRRDVETEITQPVNPPVQHPIDANLHYTADVAPADTSLSPVLMDEFIRKLAAYNGVEPEASDCTVDSTHAGMVCTAYVFPDTKEVDVFERLLLAAIAYDDTAPGYLFNYSHQQFFFTMNDLHTQRTHLWIAERVAGGRILLYTANSPIGAEMSSECFQMYRNKLNNTINLKMTEL